MNKTIVFQVFDWEKLGKAECIGEVIMSTTTILQDSPNYAPKGTNSCVATQLEYGDRRMEGPSQDDRN